MAVSVVVLVDFELEKVALPKKRQVYFLELGSFLYVVNDHCDCSVYDLYDHLHYEH